MPSKIGQQKRKIIEYIPHDEPGEIESPIVPQDEAEQGYENFVKSFPQEGVVIKVNRITGENGKLYCFRAAPHELGDVQEHLRLFHSKQPFAQEVGNYTLEVFVNGELRTTFPQNIAPQAPPQGTAGTMASAPGSDVIRLLMEQNARLEQRLLQVQQHDREPIGALADAMLKIQQIQGGGSKQELPLDTIMKAIELGKDLNAAPNDDWKSWLMPVLKESLPVIQGIVAGARQQQQQALPQQVQPGGQQTVPINTDDQMLHAGIAYLKQKCLSRSHPGLYVDLVFDNKDNPQYAALIRRILTSEFSEFVSLDPQLGQPPYREFFEFFFNGLRSAFAEDNPLDDDSDGTGGDTANPSSNGSSGKAGSKKP